MSGSSCERNQKRRNAFRLAPVLSRPSPSLTTPNPAVDVGPSAATMEQGPNRAKTTFGAPFFFFPPGRYGPAGMDRLCGKGEDQKRTERSESLDMLLLRYWFPSRAPCTVILVLLLPCIQVSWSLTHLHLAIHYVLPCVHPSSSRPPTTSTFSFTFREPDELRQAGRQA